VPAAADLTPPRQLSLPRSVPRRSLARRQPFHHFNAPDISPETPKLLLIKRFPGRCIFFNVQDMNIICQGSFDFEMLIFLFISLHYMMCIILIIFVFTLRKLKINGQKVKGYYSCKTFDIFLDWKILDLCNLRRRGVQKVAYFPPLQGVSTYQ
jgi:hypothetical protein